MIVSKRLAALFTVFLILTGPAGLQAAETGDKPEVNRDIEEMPVVIVYLTASVEPGGKVRFYKDVYNRDQKVLDALNGPVIMDVPNS